MMRSLRLVLVLAALPAMAAADTPKNLAAYLDDDTLAIVRLDVAKFDSAVIFQPVLEILQGDPTVRALWVERKRTADNLISMIRTAGGKKIYVVGSLGDLPSPGPFVLATMNEGASGEALLALFKQFQQRPPFDTCVRRDDVVYLGTAATLNRLVRQSSKRQVDLSGALQVAGDSMVQLLLIPSADHLRVIREMVPTMPASLGGVDGADLSSGFRWASLSVDPRSVRLVVQAGSDQSAEKMGQFMLGALRFLARQPEVRAVVPEPDKLLSVLKPSVHDSRVLLVLNDENRGIDALIAALKPPIRRARLNAQRRQQMNTMKQIGLAMHNHYNVYKRLPAQANYDKDGNPLLSWRVHVLPFVEEAELYAQFHLDEPWDSPHNKTLLPKMPQIYATPKFDARSGQTTLLVPYGKDTVFEGKQGLEFKQITDGTSNTIMALLADEKSAVTWTKPADLDIDLENPKRGLVGQKLTKDAVFVVLFCDGSAHALPQDIDAEKLRRLLQRNDGKRIEH